MSAETFELVLRAQMVASLAILALLALRRLHPALDPDARIWLWALPPAAVFGSLMPKEALNAPATGALARGLEPWLPALLDLWLAGAAAALLWVVLAHLAFLREVKRGRAGPAVVGFACPRIVMPDAPRFAPEERTLIRAHEWEHIRRGDLGVRNLLVLVQCLFWFNPLVHLAAAELRLDQELACDEAVVRRLGRRRLYAETLLKCAAAPPSPLGCSWLGRGVHPLETRIAALTRRPAGEDRRVLTAGFALAAGLLAAVAAQALAPAQRPAWRADWPAGYPAAEGPADVSLPRLSGR